MMESLATLAPCPLVGLLPLRDSRVWWDRQGMSRERVQNPAESRLDFVPVRLESVRSVTGYEVTAEKQGREHTGIRSNPFSFRHIAVVSWVGKDDTADHPIFLSVLDLQSSKRTSILRQRYFTLQRNTQLHQSLEIHLLAAPSRRQSLILAISK